jgi:uncharacterized protein YjbI with pentapeptide repeats
MSKKYYDDKVFVNEDFSIVNEIGEYDSCVFRNCTFANANISMWTFNNCVFDGCDLSMAKLQRTGISNSKFISCKLLGIHFEDSNAIVFSASFKNCNLNLSSFFKMKIKKMSFANCSLQEVDFTNTDLSESVFAECDLLKAHFENTILDKTDFRSAFNFSIRPDENRLKKTKFSRETVTGLLHHLDIIID